MATKVKPCRIQATGTPQAWYVPKYVDEDTFQWWAGWAWSWDVSWPASSTDWDVAIFDWATGKLIKDSWVSLSDYQEKLTAWTNIQIQNNVISATAWSDIVYATQAEYNALLPWAASDWKHYFIYTGSSSSRLPAEYQEVEYIENSWTQYIKTELDIKDGYRLVQKLRFLTSVSSLNNLAWGYLGNSGNTYYRLYLFWPQNNALSIGYLNYEQYNINVITWTDYVIDYSWISGNMHLIIDGNTIATQSWTYSTSLAWKVCVMWGYRQDASPQYWANAWMRLYESQIYDSGWTKVRDLVPCYRKADSVIWMYDLENDQFYTNAGSWTFTKWSDV